MPYYQKITYSGPVMEVERYYATDGGRPMGSRSAEESTRAQDELNDVQSWRKLWRILQCNFSRRQGDLIITLKFSRWVEAEEARKHYERFLKKVRSIRKARGMEDLKYIIVKEVQSGRQHAHVVLNGGITIEELTEIWGVGDVWGAVVSDTNNYKELAAYLNRQHKPRRGSGTTENAKEPRQRGKRRWTTSRNLKKPVVKKRECRPVTMKTMPAVPQGHRGYTLMPEFERGADRFGNLWLRWMCVKTSEVSEPWDMDRATRRKVE